MKEYFAMGRRMELELIFMKVQMSFTQSLRAHILMIMLYEEAFLIKRID